MSFKSYKTWVFASFLMMCGAIPAASQVVVSSKIDTEGGVLGQMIVQVLKHAGIPVESRVQLGATAVVRKAMLAGEIDIYPEYTGNAAFFFNKADDPVWKNAKQAYETARNLDRDANKIVWLAPAPANNTWAIAIRRDIAEQNKLKTMSDFGAYVAKGGKVKLAGSAEFVNSAAALPSFQTAYGFTMKSDQLVVLAGGDTSATIQAAAQQISGVNAAMVYGTDGAISAAGLIVLDDDKGVQPVYQPTAIVRDAVLMKYPTIATVIEPVFAGLDLLTLQELNGRVQVNGENAEAVALDYLKRKKFVP